ncbi:hypothetical protein [Polyangium jinanense]|uniref:Uncharacterized protein n=1 Tax=Polyangium jinanense TaxID=2829994 RepID=A0A9X3X513_9BACT|nr:hypothetical protein [Polyangium jinanense]MDC3956099.1 hypothetical protein [Polyangium jinanense]MDC3982870.1 hypothetical protein [Polyangium jinanense]
MRVRGEAIRAGEPQIMVMVKTNEPSGVEIKRTDMMSSDAGRQEPDAETGNEAEAIAGDPPGSGSPLGRVGGPKEPVDPSDRGGGPGIGGSGGS